MRVVSFKVDEDLHRLMEEHAREAGIPKSELIRQAVRFYINEVLTPRRVYITRRIRVY